MIFRVGFHDPTKPLYEKYQILIEQMTSVYFTMALAIEIFAACLIFSSFCLNSVLFPPCSCHLLKHINTPLLPQYCKKMIGLNLVLF